MSVRIRSEAEILTFKKDEHRAEVTYRERNLARLSKGLHKNPILTFCLPMGKYKEETYEMNYQMLGQEAWLPTGAFI